MRILMTVKMPTKEFNAALARNEASQRINRILEESRPESVYFTEEQGVRTALLVVNMEDSSQIPRLAEPWFLSFNASVEFRIAMNQEDLRKAGLDELGKKWGQQG